MQGYYSARLAGRRLERCYDLASARVRRHLAAEVEFVLGQLRPTDDVLEPGCGYGRVTWFEAQAADGLLGATDRERTGDGTIACADGFRAGTIDVERFRALGRRLGIEPAITAVDDSSEFCELRPG